MSGAPGFRVLDPLLALDAAEEAYGLALSAAFTVYPSYVNRVFGFKADDGKEYVAKFYRPQRWTADAIREEHRFLEELEKSEVPVVTPLPGLDGDTLQTLGVESGDDDVLIHFTLFPKRGGRGFEPSSDDDWVRLGTIVGRVHSVGRSRAAPGRVAIVPGLPEAYLGELRRANAVHPDCAPDFEEITAPLSRAIDDALASMRAIRIHGDCHRGNILDRSGEGLRLVDFDDMANGPAIQDLWLLMPDRIRACGREFSLVLSGYETFSSFDVTEIRNVECLRALRMLHYLAWQARQRDDPGFRNHFPDWGTRAFWIREIEDLRRQAEEIFGNG